ncbi:MAG: hypothetical protein [Betatorquevirus homini20]|uniref:Uncharacterized protein n=1 Tax=Anelloviridae sp. TaxID=2055263 RepID=A0A385E245_9VIRU|nr:MAG: hypothetical protein QKC61_gp2 [Anelloviridae sp.]AXQ65863.1 MAG: hypothetical protein [Anelloviridae sp.]
MSYSKLSRRDNLQLVNTYVAIHDLKCTCNKPLECILDQINNQEPTLQIKYKKSCLTSTATGEHHGGDAAKDVPIGDAELEKIFAEDATETVG